MKNDYLGQLFWPVSQIDAQCIMLGFLMEGYVFFFHSPGQEKRIVGEGMPLVDNPTKRGDLVVKFQLKFPSSLDKRQKLLLKQALIE